MYNLNILKQTSNVDKDTYFNTYNIHIVTAIAICMPILYNISYSKYLQTCTLCTLYISIGCTSLAVPNQVIVIQDIIVNIKRHLRRFLHNYSICNNMLKMDKMCKFQTQ